jgi:hypothetical protein
VLVSPVLAILLRLVLVLLVHVILVHVILILAVLLHRAVVAVLTLGHLILIL